MKDSISYNSDLQDNIVFPEDFVLEAKKLYPDWTDLHTSIRLGKRVQTGRMLDNASGFVITVDDVIRHFKRKTEDDLLVAAKKAKKKRDLYRKFLELEDLFLERNNAR